MLLLSATAAAQSSAQSKDGPYVESFSGFSYALGGNGDAPGFITSLAFNRSRYHGYFGEFSRHYGVPRSNLPGGEIEGRGPFGTLLFGVQFYIKKHSPVSPFLRLMVGGSMENSAVNYAPQPIVGAGGGVDVRISDRFAFRAIQVDHLNPGKDKQKRVRLSSGLVVRF